MSSHAATEMTNIQAAHTSDAARTAAKSGKRTPQQAQASKALCDELAQLLYAACEADQDFERSGNAARLLSMAGNNADLAAGCEWRQSNPEDEIYNVAALMSAASRVPGDTMGPARSELLSQAWDRLLQLTESGRRKDIDDSFFAKQSVARACSGFNAVQLGMALEVIAGEADTLCELLQFSEQGSGDAKRTAFAAARIVAESICSKADTASGAGIRGDADTWHYGAAFEMAGGARGTA